MNYLGTLIIFIVVSFLMKYLMASSKKQPIINKKEVMTLKMNKAYGIIGYIGITFTAAIGIIASLGTVKSNEDLFIVIGLVLFFLMLSVPLVLVSKKMKVEADNEKVRYFGINGKTKIIMWSEINNVKFSKSMLELTLITDSTKVKIHMHLIGFSGFIELMRSNIDYTLYKDAINRIENVNKRY